MFFHLFFFVSIKIIINIVFLFVFASTSPAYQPFRSTCGEYQDRVVPQSLLLQHQGDVAHCLVHGRHHASILPAGVVFDESVGGHVALRHLQRRMDRLQRHIEEERLEDTETDV